MAEAVETANRNGRLRVVVIDRDPDVRSALGLILSREAGIRVVCEDSSVDCLLDCAGESCPDLVLIGWDRPRPNLAQVLPALRSSCPGVMAVALSTRVDDRAAAIADGADAFVCKADAPDELLATLRGLIRSSSSEPAPTQSST